MSVLSTARMNLDNSRGLEVLQIIPYAPSLVRVRPYQLACGLHKLGCRVTVATTFGCDRDKLSLEELRSSGIDVASTHLTRFQSLKNCLKGLFGRLPLQSVYCWQPLLAGKIRDQLSKRKFDIVHIEHLRGAVYGLYVQSLLRERLAPAAPLIWDSVDCISSLAEQSLQKSPSAAVRLVSQIELRRTRFAESWLTGQFDRVIVTTTREKEFLKSLKQSPAHKRAGGRLRVPGVGIVAATNQEQEDGLSPIHVISNGVDLDYFRQRDQSEEAQDPLVVISGKMSYHANVAAAARLIREIMPWVWAVVPNARVRIIGQSPPASIRALGLSRSAGNRIEVTGTVSDIRPWLRPAWVAAAPMPYAVGIQNKVLEAMAVGIPVVATPVVAEGMRARCGQELLVGSSDREIADHIVSILNDADLRRRLGYAGRGYVETHHRWEQKAHELAMVYREASHAGDGVGLGRNG